MQNVYIITIMHNDMWVCFILGISFFFHSFCLIHHLYLHLFSLFFLIFMSFLTASTKAKWKQCQKPKVMGRANKWKYISSSFSFILTNSHNWKSNKSNNIVFQLLIHNINNQHSNIKKFIFRLLFCHFFTLYKLIFE